MVSLEVVIKPLVDLRLFLPNHSNYHECQSLITICSHY